MPHITADRVLETTTTTGTGALTLAGAVTGYRTFASVCATNDTCFYAIEAVDGSGVPTGDWETGLGTYSGTNTLTRTTVLASSNAGSAVNFGAGTKRVFITAAGARGGFGVMSVAESAPATPPAGVGAIYRDVLGGWEGVGGINAAGQRSRFQRSLAVGTRQEFAPYANSTNTTFIGCLGNLNGQTARAPATTNLFTSLARLGLVSVATAGNACFIRSSGTTGSAIWRGNASGLGGFVAVFRFGISDAAAVADARMFVGFLDGGGAPGNVNPTTFVNCIGIGCDNGGTTLSIIYNDASGTASTISLGANFPANTLSTDVYELTLWAAPNSSSVTYLVRRLNTTDTATGTLTTDIPASTVFLFPLFWRNNGATALAVGLDVFLYYAEQDHLR